MSHVLKLQNHLTFEDYLEGERFSEIKHEFVGGRVYAMAGTSEAHNRISGNVFGALDDQLHSGPCRTFVADMKIKVWHGPVETSYYPDVFVTCDPRDTHSFFKEFPDTVFEVLSNSTEGTDRREKFLAYRSIATLNNYVLISQKRVEVTLFQRSTHWQPEIFTDLQESLYLASLKTGILLSRIYRNVNFLDADPPNDHELTAF